MDVCQFWHNKNGSSVNIFPQTFYFVYLTLISMDWVVFTIIFQQIFYPVEVYLLPNSWEFRATHRQWWGQRRPMDDDNRQFVLSLCQISQTIENAELTEHKNMSDFKLRKLCWIQWKLPEKLSLLKRSITMLRRYKHHHIQVSIRYVLRINQCFILMIVHTGVTPLWWHCCPIFIENNTWLASGGASYISYFAWIVLRSWYIQ